MKPLSVYFYHNRPIQKAYDEWKEGKHPGHILYGVTEFPKYDIKPIFHIFRKGKNRLVQALVNAKEVFGKSRRCDMLYATHSLGLELILVLKALRLYNKPIVLWQHRVVHHSRKPAVNAMHKFFYRGVDKLLFFTPLHVDESVQTGIVSREKCVVIKWGPDLDFYDAIQKNKNSNPDLYISTGKENRDFTTLIKAFSGLDARLEIYSPIANGNHSYHEELDVPEGTHKNIAIYIVEGIIPYELAVKVANSYAIVISCTNQKYSVGLTTLVEALALGKPVITSDNPYFDIDIEKNNCGIKVPYGDIQRWRSAIDFLEMHKEKAIEMGANARKLAEREYNLKLFSKDIVDIFRTLS